MLVPARSDAATAARTSRALRVASTSVEAWLLAGLTGLGAVLRFATLGAQSYWFDEAQAAHELHLSFSAMWSSMVGVETNPPLYFTFGWLWARVFGTGEVGLRSLSALAGTALIPIAYLCGRELASRRAGLVAAGLTAVSPFMIYYSQEAREYMLLAALSGASFLFFARAWHDPSRRNIVLWAVFSGLALLTHFFAGFLIAPEAVWLLYVVRNRTIGIAAGAVAAVEFALVPILVTQANPSLLGFITATPLSLRIQQVPVAFGLGPLWEGPLVSYGLLGAAVLAGIVIVLLLVGADAKELRGAGLAAAVAGFVLVAPLVVAVLGKDYYIQRALIPAWVPLTVVIGAACTTRRLRVPGGILAAVLLGGMVWGQIKVSGDPAYQRPDWRGVASALGSATGRRAIVVYDGALATDPLMTYVPRVPWSQPTGPLSVDEVDVVGYTWQTLRTPLPAGVEELGSKRVNGYLVDRFSVDPTWGPSQGAIAQRAGALLVPVPASPAVLIQNPPASR
jgi:mannosyltransferase